MTEIAIKQGDLFQLDSPLYGDVQGERTVAEFPFFASSKKAQMTPMVFESGDARIEINPSKTGVATIYDKEILLYIASLMAKRMESGEVVDRVWSFTANDLFRVTSTNSSARCYTSLKASLTGRRYSGINVLVLWATAAERGYAGQGWLTFRQAQALGGSVRKGERGTTVCYADRFTPKDAGEHQAVAAGDVPRQVAFLKRFTVFNVEQCDGLSETLSIGGWAFLDERQTIACAETLIATTGASIAIGGDQAFYMPSVDHIQLPPQQAFRDQINFYRTALHELGHWTGYLLGCRPDVETVQEVSA